MPERTNFKARIRRFLFDKLLTKLPKSVLLNTVSRLGKGQVLPLVLSVGCKSMQTGCTCLAAFMLCAQKVRMGRTEINIPGLFDQGSHRPEACMLTAWDAVFALLPTALRYAYS